MKLGHQFGWRQLVARPPAVACLGTRCTVSAAVAVASRRRCLHVLSASSNAPVSAAKNTDKLMWRSAMSTTATAASGRRGAAFCGPVQQALEQRLHAMLEPVHLEVHLSPATAAQWISPHITD